MTTVLTVPGIFTGIGKLFGKPDPMPPFYRQACTTVEAMLPERVASDWGPVTSVSEVKYRNSSIFGQFDGEKKLDQALTPGQTLAMTHSMGSYAAWLWLRDYAPTSTLNPDDVVFLMSGADQTMMAAPHITASRYRILCVIRQWEKYGDPPNVPASRFFPNAEKNVKALDLHRTGFHDIDLNTDPAMSKVVGSCTYLFYPTLQPAPSVDATRPQIETAYNRTYLT